MTSYVRWEKLQLLSFLMYTLDVDELSTSRLGHFYPWERTHRLLNGTIPVKSKVIPLQARLWPRGWVEVQLYSFMIAALEGCEWSAARPGRNRPPGKTRNYSSIFSNLWRKQRQNAKHFASRLHFEAESCSAVSWNTTARTDKNVVK